MVVEDAVNIKVGSTVINNSNNKEYRVIKNWSGRPNTITKEQLKNKHYLFTLKLK